MSTVKFLFKHILFNCSGMALFSCAQLSVFIPACCSTSIQFSISDSGPSPSAASPEARATRWIYENNLVVYYFIFCRGPHLQQVAFAN